MKFGELTRYFTGIAAKRLADVEVNRLVSHQHEFNGDQALVRLLGKQRWELDASFVRLTDTAEPVRSPAKVTWYDARENQTYRSPEFRLYYTQNDAIDGARSGDLLVVARTQSGQMMVILTEAGSTVEAQIVWLFGLGDADTGPFQLAPLATAATDERVDFMARTLLQELGIDAIPVDEDALGGLIDTFGHAFPPTREFSEYARTNVPHGDRDDPDRMLVAWMEREETLFRTLERHLIAERLQRGFAGDVDSFIAFSLSVQNRRKSRAGLAFEHHVRYLLDHRGVAYAWHSETEPGARPDFLFPGKAAYDEASFPSSRLHLLAVKSSCKDRWRQVLAEAMRIEEKHLLTLEGRITPAQTDEMCRHQLQLVVPAPVQVTYTRSQRTWLMSVSEFLELVAYP
ncbi:MAG: restriction endonuclease [Dehalococcoidia bacterium]|nr:restriction endonuclease [Dehalococcoidia bacterium]